MGWTGIYTTKSFEKVFNDEFPNVTDYSEVIAIPESGCAAESEFYAAIKHSKGYTFGGVFLFKRYIDAKGKEEVMFKVMDESMEPFYYNCPERIFKLLSPLSQMPYVGSAKDWRKKVVAIHASGRPI